jgi:hypothetical protein
MKLSITPLTPRGMAAVLGIAFFIGVIVGVVIEFIAK